MTQPMSAEEWESETHNVLDSIVEAQKCGPLDFRAIIETFLDPLTPLHTAAIAAAAIQRLALR